MTLAFFSSLKSTIKTLYPPALKKGDRIALVFPASYLHEPDETAQHLVQKGATWIERRGYKTMMYPKHIQPEDFFSGTKEERTQALMDAWKNPEIKAIWCFRGGYGSQTLLDHIDYNYIRRHPKIFLGMSDITALHQALHQKTGLVTFLAPIVHYFNQSEDTFDKEYAFSSLEKILVEGCTNISLPPDYQVSIMHPGKAQGKLIGGTLSLIASLCGTKWQLDTRGKIVLLEEISEPAYKIDRMFWQLDKAGLLKNPAAVILASWNINNIEAKDTKQLRQVFQRYFATASYPVIVGFPSGHCKHQATLALGATYQLHTDMMRVSLLEPAILLP